jgi:protein-S-isoprenylcysteine O-methyltransferase Ste14
VWLFVRSAFWTIAMPGIVAGYVPWRIAGRDFEPRELLTPAHLLGCVVVAVGAALLAACIVEFARSGRGTLSPVDPPTRLVVRGLYRYVRNPMYVGVTCVILGEALVTGSSTLVWYWAVFFAAANLFVLGYEEPALRRRFGASYDDYRRLVGRWIPKLR